MRLLRYCLGAIAATLLPACSAYLGSAHPIERPAAASGLLLLDDVEIVQQSRPNDCGQAALCMALHRLGDDVDLDQLLRECPPPASGGTSMQALRDAARARGFAAFVLQGSLADVREHLGKRRSLVVGMQKRFTDGERTHYELVVGLHDGEDYVLTADPARGFTRNTLAAFTEEWRAVGAPLLLVAPRDPLAEAVRSLLQ